MSGVAQGSEVRRFVAGDAESLIVAGVAVENACLTGSGQTVWKKS